MLKYYYKIPKKLRSHFWKVKRREVWSIIRTFLIINKLFKNRKNLFNMGEIQDNLDLPDNHIYWLVNNTERYNGDNSAALSYTRCVYGHEQFQIDNGFNYPFAKTRQKKKQFKKWLRRNNRWNGRAKDGLKFNGGDNLVLEEVIINQGEADATNWRDEQDKGIQCVILRLIGTDELYFRYSFNLKLWKLSPVRFFGYNYISFGAGVEGRYILKFRFF